MRRVPSRLASLFLGLALAVVAVSAPAPVSAESSSPVLSEIVKKKDGAPKETESVLPGSHLLLGSSPC